MKPQAVRICSIILAVFTAAALILIVHGENGDDAVRLEIGVSCTDTNADAGALTDNVEKTYTAVAGGTSVTVTSKDGTPIGSLYVIFDCIYGDWTLSGSDSEGNTHTVSCGGDRFLHEYIDVEHDVGDKIVSLTLTFGGDEASLSEIYAFSSGKVPDWVQIWQPPCSRADLLLTSTHIDDEQLFFAGVLPYYAGERGYAVQVVYFTDPFKYHDRPHEQLNGLWTVGVRNYPVCGNVTDEYSETAKDAYAIEKKHGNTKEDLVKFQVEMIRRFKPHVVVGHDIKGEYSHGQHIINCETLMEALPLAADASYDPETAESYGVWDVPKTYIHLWSENEIVMNWDVPLEAFGGRTAFEMTQEGFKCHKSQHWTWFYGWIYGKNGNKITKAADIKTYSPCKYGLYRTNVGLDKNASSGFASDMFENIPLSYAEIEKAERDALAAAESERVAEESKRLESEKAESLRTETESERSQSEMSAAEGQPPSKDTDSANNNNVAGKSSNVPQMIAVAVCIVAVAVAIAAAAGVKKTKQDRI